MRTTLGPRMAITRTLSDWGFNPKGFRAEGFGVRGSGIDTLGFAAWR